MLALSRKQLTVLLLVLVSFIIIMVASMMIIRATHAGMWHQFVGWLPQVLSHY